VSDTVVSLLTPPGTGAIATVEVRGPRAWELAKQLFKPAGKPLPETPEVNHFWFGTLGSDEVVLAVTERGASTPCVVVAQGADAPRSVGCTVEVHCHGGRRVVRWVIEQFLSHGCTEKERTPRPLGEGFELLQRAPTLRTASILLDQLNGAFALEVQRILGRLKTDPNSVKEPLRRLAELGRTVGRHLVEPWKVVIAGPPNVGKSSLINALAGYQRSVVSEVAGTTRDAVSVRTAFDGWPVELIDTAGLRDAEGLEAEGIGKAEQQMAAADLVVWLMDNSDPNPVWGPETIPRSRLLAFITKCDLPCAWNRDDWGDSWGITLVSTVTGSNLAGVAQQIVEKLVQRVPDPGTAIPFTSQLAELIETANAALEAGEPDEAAHFLRESHHVG
jgi:tRNA modification GTPase